jgi:hypothetical protein
MKDVGDLLRDGDPIAREGGMSDADISRMRRAVVSAANHESAMTAWWPRPILIAATVAVTIVAGVIVGHRLPPRDAAIDDIASAPSSRTVSAERRQLQFASPGGTRIIWVFDPEFTP